MASASGNQSSDGGVSGLAKLWLFIIAPLVALLIAILVSVGWYMIGGWPGGHDKYGKVPVPGQATVTLPEGEIRLYWEARSIGSGDNQSVAGRPGELEVAVIAADGTVVPTSSVPSWLFSSTNNTTGHEPYLKMTAPAPGEYTVVAVMTMGGPPPALAAVTVGAAPWNPGNSRLGGAIIVGLVILMLGLLPMLVVSMANKRQNQKPSLPSSGGKTDVDPDEPAVSKDADAKGPIITIGSDPPDESDKRYDW